MVKYLFRRSKVALAPPRLQETTAAAVGTCVVNRRTNDKAIRVLNLVNQVIAGVIAINAKGTIVVSAGITSGASSNRLVANVKDIPINLLLIECFGYFTQCGIGASSFMRASVN